VASDDDSRVEQDQRARLLDNRERGLGARDAVTDQPKIDFQWQSSEALARDQTAAIRDQTADDRDADTRDQTAYQRDAAADARKRAIDALGAG
jgi:hypothetical protein